MEGKTHRTFGVVAMEVALISAGVLPGWKAAAALVVAGISAYGPDLDSPESTIARSIPGAGIIGHFLKHRTVLHSLLVTALLWLLIDVTQVPWLVLAGVIVGWSSHWFIDLFNREGVQLFWPLPMWIKVFPGEMGVVTGGAVEFLIRKILMMVEIVVLWLYFSPVILVHLTDLPFARHLIVFVHRVLGVLDWSVLYPLLHAILHMP